MTDVPVDAFWSISVCNAQGFFEKNECDRYTVDSLTATPNSDGSVIVRFCRRRADDAEQHSGAARLELSRPWMLPAAEPVPAS